jgi:hypothetical protein
MKLAVADEDRAAARPKMVPRSPKRRFWGNVAAIQPLQTTRDLRTFIYVLSRDLECAVPVHR